MDHMDHLTSTELELLVEALRMAGSRHESMGHDTTGRFRGTHFDKAERMERLRLRLLQCDGVRLLEDA
jgi:hypothetical protein